MLGKALPGFLLLGQAALHFTERLANAYGLPGGGGPVPVWYILMREAWKLVSSEWCGGTGQCCWHGGTVMEELNSLRLSLSCFSPSPDLHRRLHRPPVHQVLALLRPICHLVVPGLGQTEKRRPAHPVLQTLGDLEYL